METLEIEYHRISGFPNSDLQIPSEGHPYGSSIKRTAIRNSLNENRATDSERIETNKGL